MDDNYVLVYNHKLGKEILVKKKIKFKINLKIILKDHKKIYK